MLLVPADPLRPRKPDEHFAAEAEAAAAAGAKVALVDHDALTEPDGAVQAVGRVPVDGGEAVYRGWMLGAGQYAAFGGALAARGVVLRTSAVQYQRAHELPGWYPMLAAVSPRAEWTAGDGREEFGQACGRLGPGPAVLRDYVKSMKHYWEEAAYIPELADHEAAWAIAVRFRQSDFGRHRIADALFLAALRNGGAVRIAKRDANSDATACLVRDDGQQASILGEEQGAVGKHADLTFSGLEQVRPYVAGDSPTVRVDRSQLFRPRSSSQWTSRVGP
jgi:hypothetical protein